MKIGLDYKENIILPNLTRNLGSIRMFTNRFAGALMKDRGMFSTTRLTPKSITVDVYTKLKHTMENNPFYMKRISEILLRGE